MVETKTVHPQLGTWAKLPTEKVERKPKVSFEANIPVELTFVCAEPKEYTGESGAYYVFDVVIGSEQKVIMTSAWTLLRSLKESLPLMGKRFRITKKIVKGKQEFEVIKL